MSELKLGDPVFVMVNSLCLGLFVREGENLSKIVEIDGIIDRYSGSSVYGMNSADLNALYDRLTNEAQRIEGQKTIVFNARRGIEHASAEEGKEYGCINGHEFDDPVLVKTGENHPHDDVELCPECGAEDIHKNRYTCLAGHRFAVPSTMQTRAVGIDSPGKHVPCCPQCGTINFTAE